MSRVRARTNAGDGFGGMCGGRGLEASVARTYKPFENTCGVAEGTGWLVKCWGCQDLGLIPAPI